MASEREIESYRKAYADYTDAQLINVTHEKVPYCADHIAAQQLLAERKERKEEERHRKIEARLEELKEPHWTVKPNFWITLVAAVAAIVAAYFAWRPQPPVVPPPQHAVAPPSASSPQKPQPAQASPKP